MSVGAIIPNRNYGRFIEQAIESLRAQTVEISDIVVVDGESEDDSVAVANSMGARIVSARPGSAGRARNIGIRTLQTEFIVPLDSDDWLEPTFVERCLEQMTAEVGAVATGLIYQPDGNVQWPDEPLTFERLCEANRMFTSSMFRREAWEAVGGYDERKEIYEDWDLWLSIAERGWRLAVVREPLFNYRLHPASSTMSCGVRHPEYVANLRRKHRLP